MAVPLLPRTLVLSVGMHVAVAVMAFRSPASPPSHSEQPSRDVWDGQAVEVDAIGLPGEGTNTTEEAEASPAPATPPAAEPTAPRTPPPEITPEGPSEVTLPRRPEPKPAPKEERSPREPRPRPVPSSSSAPPAAGERLAAAPASATPEASARGAFGMTGLPQGVRHLPYAFTRALPQASSGDESWASLPLGAAGAIEIEIPVAADGKLGELSYAEPKRAAQQVAAVRHAVERTMILLRAGTFSLAPNQLEHGVQRLRIEFELSEVSSEGGDGVDHFQKGFVAPALGRPGRSIFVSSSGRRVEARVHVIP